MTESAKPADIVALMALARGTRFESVANDEQALERFDFETAFGAPESEEPPEPKRRPDEDEAFTRGILRKRK